jgi:hypothetical protein
MIKTIEFYDNCDVYIGQERNNNTPDELKLGILKTKTFGEVIDMAIQFQYNIIIKSGTGKWYLKKGDYEISKQKMQENLNKYVNRKCWIVQFI